MSGDTHLMVTGAAAGIRRATALQGADSGMRLTLIDLHREAVEPVAREARLRGAAEVLSIACDVSVEEQVAESIAASTHQLGPRDRRGFVAGGVGGFCRRW